MPKGPPLELSQNPILVLVVDDDPAAAERFGDVLQQAGFAPRLLVASRRDDVVAALHRGLDAVIADLDFPGFDGFAVLQAVHDLGLDVPVIVVSRVFDEERAVACVRAGAADYVLRERLRRLPISLERAVQGRAKDATRRRVEEELSRIDTRYRRIIEHSVDAISIVDPVGTTLWTTPAIEAILGSSAIEIVGKPASELVHPDDLPNVAAVLGRLLAHEEEGLPVEFRLRHRDGTWRTVEVRGRDLTNEPAIGGILIGIRDVTERVAAQAERRKLTHELQERVKELSLLHYASRTVQSEHASSAELLHAIANLIPAAMQYPEVAAARIRFDGREHATTRWTASAAAMISVSLSVSGHGQGWIDIAYTEARPACDEGPFLAEERRVLESLAELLASHIAGHEMQRSLGESEARFRELASAIREIFYLVELGSNRVLYVSPEYERLWGRSADSLYASGMSFIDVVHPDDRDRVAAWARQPVLDTTTVEYRIVRDDGSTRWIRDSLSPIRNESGAVVRLAGIASDVTELKQSEAARELLARIVDASSEAIMSATLDGEVSTWNGGAERLFGYTRDEIVGRPLSKFYVDGEASSKSMPFVRALRGEFVEGFETQRKRKDGTVVDVSVTVNPITDESGATVAIGAIIRDISPQKQILAELAHARDAALEASRMKSIFLATMSHEIRTPLNVVLGYSSLLADQVAERKEEWAAPLVEAVQRGGRRLLTTFSRMLDVARFETNDFVAHPEPIELGVVVPQLIEPFEDAARAKGLALSVESSAEAICIVGDSYCLTQAIQNILENAIKFTEQGRIRVTLETAGDTARITVTDTGIGIGPTFLSRLFEPFSQEDGGTTRRFEGTGLGLALARRYVERLGGVLTVASEKGQGSTFTIDLPMPRRSEARQPHEAAELASG